MCLIAFALDAHPRYRLVLAGNRDEFFRRETDPAHWWPDQSGLLAGRDRLAQGTWLAIHRRGRIAAVTNVREGTPAPRTGPSRGGLPLDFVRADTAPLAHAHRLTEPVAQPEQAYAGFNLLMFDLAARAPLAAWASNRHPQPAALGAGVYGLSNHLIDTPWPKLEQLKRRLGDALTAGHPTELEHALFDALADDLPVPDEALPSTGIAIERERMLSSAFVRSSDYGTRACSVLLVDRDGGVRFVERSWSEPVQDLGRHQERRFEFRLPAAAERP